MSAQSRRDHLRAVTPDADVTEADWWDTEWPPGKTPPAVGFLIPAGFEAYARVLHPAEKEGAEVGWAEVAAEMGTVLHPAAQWWRVARRAGWFDSESGWPGENPNPGYLEAGRFGRLAEILNAHTRTPERTFVAFWAGNGALPSSWLGLPQVIKPGREYFLFARALAEVPALCADVELIRFAQDGPAAALETFGDGALFCSPSQWWPADRAWAYSCDTDLDSTLIGGSADLVADLITDDLIEAFALDEQVSLTVYGDTVNVPDAD